MKRKVKKQLNNKLILITINYITMKKNILVLKNICLIIAVMVFYCTPSFAQYKLTKDLDNPKYNFSELDKVVKDGIADSTYPGAVILVTYKGKIVYEKAFGSFTYDKASTPMSVNSMFDMASVSKVVGTTTAAMMLFDQGKFKLDDKVTKYIPDFGQNGKDKITIRNLLLHNAGLVEWIPFYKKFTTPEQVWDSIKSSKLIYPTGTKYAYSDLGLITMQKVIEKISGKHLDDFLRENVFKPLKMHSTMYNPPAKLVKDCVPTEVDNYWRMTTMQGKVHDETAYLLGGVAGHAGLFSTAPDLAVFMQMLLNKGSYNGKRYVKASTVNSWTTKQSAQSSRGIGWDTNDKWEAAAGKKFSETTFGHTGFTGTSVFADKERGVVAILLTNRVYPTRNNPRLTARRHSVHDAIIKAIDNKN
jgi:CubicO group peptidase (beta-lactamase class C family)